MEVHELKVFINCSLVREDPFGNVLVKVSLTHKLCCYSLPRS